MIDLPRIRKYRRLWLLGWLVVIVAGVAVLIDQWPETPVAAPPAAPPAEVSQPVAAQTFPLPAFSESPYLNTRSDAKYIGTAACAACHTENHRSYLHTAHSRALTDADPNTEPPDGTFEHAASGRSYRVYRQDGKLYHEESLRTVEGKEMGRTALPVRYLVGSGHFSRTFLVEVEGFLHESPITWYASRKRWDMSPGYDVPQHAGFERPVGTDCLVCHAGRMEAKDGSFHRVAFQEKAIGCENCHGPGSLHRDFHTTRKLALNQRDFTIVNPAKLSRQLREDICAACHQSGTALVPLRGRELAEFRPGLPMSDFRIHYRLGGSDNGKMTVVGHVDQLQMSACYQKSQDLTCVTCHDPHQREAPKNRVEFFRQKCLDCHTTKTCDLAPAERLKKEPADNCMSCHMPRGDTDIPHIAFTHHRIGVHSAKHPPAATTIPELVPVEDVSRLAAIDQRRGLGLAYLEASRKSPGDPLSGVYRVRARDILEGVWAAGLHDGMTAAALAEICWNEDIPRAVAFARQSLAANDTPPNVRTGCEMILAYSEIRHRDFAAAIGPLEKLVRIRRFSEDWRLLGMSYLRQNEPQKALTALQQARAIRPFRPTIHGGLSEVYRTLGDNTTANEYQEKFRWLSLHRQD